MSSEKIYHGFLIDADNTLFDFDKAEHNALYETLQNLQIDPEGVYPLFQQINEQIWREFEEGLLSYNQIKIKRFERLLDTLGLQNDADRFSSLYLEILSTKDYLLPHAAEVLDALSKRTSLVLLSNGISLVQRGRIARSGLEAFFQDILISEEIGISKPAPEIFHLGLKSLQLPAHSVLVVGDRPSSDIRGGYLAGLDTCWFCPSGQPYPAEEPPPNFTIDSLTDLLHFAAEYC